MPIGLYWHGGAPGLKMILPPSITGVASCADYGASAVCRRDRVYITTKYEAALMFAAMHPSGEGMVYVVEPIAPLEPDPDCDAPGLSYACRKAKVVMEYPPSKVERMLMRDFRLHHFASPQEIA